MTTQSYTAYIPFQITQGTSVKWETYADEYPSSEYSLSTVFFSAKGTTTVSGSTYGTGWRSELSTTTSAELFPGLYGWQSFVSKTGERILVASGTMEVLADSAATQIPLIDPRSNSKQVYDNISALLSNPTYVKSLDPDSLANLIQLHKSLHWDVLREQDAAKLSQGTNTTQKIYTRFTRET